VAPVMATIRRRMQGRPMQNYCAPRSCVCGAQRALGTPPLLDATSGLLAMFFTGLRA
jgi:hypothetical protein